MKTEAPIYFHNTLSGTREEFKSIHAGEVRMYTCGPTVYDFAHIGNFRTFVFEDLLRRTLEFRGFNVKHVMNITDVDDKTIQGALREGVPLDEYTGRYTIAFQDDLRTLNILPPNWPEEQPCATKEIPAMIALIEKLAAGKTAYESDGSVYYRAAAFSGYGKLSKKNLEKNIAGARVDSDEYEKEEASDFVLWKKAKEGEPSWDSPWGKGRPGWHIECSAMSIKYLGETFDLHAGGEDLIFPHHENEIAQSEAATGKKPFVRYWLHSKHLLVNGEKMSKSKGNFYTLRDLTAKGFDPMAVRYVLLSVHYRSPLNFTLEALKEADAALEKIYDAYYLALSYTGDLDELGESFLSGAEDGLFETEITQNLDAVSAALSDDLNIAGALAHLFSGVTAVNKALSACPLPKHRVEISLGYFSKIERLLGFGITRFTELPPEIRKLVNQRHRVRIHPEFKQNKEMQAESDRLRNEISAKGWLVKDTRPGQPLMSSVKFDRHKTNGAPNGRN